MYRSLNSIDNYKLAMTNIKDRIKPNGEIQKDVKDTSDKVNAAEKAVLNKIKDSSYHDLDPEYKKDEIKKIKKKST
jgi:hypothetical protein